MKLHLVLLVLLCLPLMGCGRSSEDTVRDFFEQISDNKIEAAAEMFSPELKARFSQDELIRATGHLAEHMRIHRGLEKVTLRGGIITYQELALYDAILAFGDGTHRKMQITVLYRDGAWRINTAL